MVGDPSADTSVHSKAMAVTCLICSKEAAVSFFIFSSTHLLHLCRTLQPHPIYEPCFACFQSFPWPLVGHHLQDEHAEPVYVYEPDDQRRLLGE